MPQTNEYTIDIPNGRVCSWYVTAQTASSKTVELYTPSNRLVFKTMVNSTKLDNFGIGSFPTSEGGVYKVKFPNCKDVQHNQTLITNHKLDTVCATHVFGGEDSGDQDFQDVFLTLTIYLKKG
ncbi:MAG: hypothetical protein F6K56_03150 [Moorea sp. SIO3G5]|nr:hypothetical protein [Moorena sp. SIO3G5]